MSFFLKEEIKYKATLMRCTLFQAQILHENNKLPRPDGHENCTTRIWGISTWKNAELRLD
jgi:hypothetical protein